MVALAHEKGFSSIIVPATDAKEASLLAGTEIIPVSSLIQLVSYLRGEISVPEYQPEESEETPKHVSAATLATDLAHIKGQEHVKRALEVSAAGGHKVIIFLYLLFDDTNDANVASMN